MQTQEITPSGKSTPAVRVRAKVGAKVGAKVQRRWPGERRWVVLKDGCLHGIQRSEVVVVRSRPKRFLTRSSFSVFSISRAAGLLALAAVLVLLAAVLSGCLMPQAQRGGQSNWKIMRPGLTNSVSLRQGENPADSTHQTVESEQTIDYLLPEHFGAGRSSSDYGSGMASGSAPGYQELTGAIPVRVRTKDRTETTLGAAQKDTARIWAAKAAQMKPVMWAGLLMMTLIPAVLIYFGWWTKAAVAGAVGVAMVVLANTLPGHGAFILLTGLGIFGFVALLVLYAYYKGRLDKDQDGIPDMFQRDRIVPF